MKLKSFLKRLVGDNVRIWDESDNFPEPLFEGACYDVPKHLQNRKIIKNDGIAAFKKDNRIWFRVTLKGE